MAARAAGLRAGWTILEVGAGNGAVSLFLAEEFHLYARGVEPMLEMVEWAQREAARSPAAGRVRFLHEDAVHADPMIGPFDAIAALNGCDSSWRRLLRPGGPLLLGRFVVRREPLPEGAAEAFAPSPPADPPGLVWKREATGIEWERFFGPQERVLRAYGETLRSGETVSPVALWADRRLRLFRDHASAIAYELCVVASGP